MMTPKEVKEHIAECDKANEDAKKDLLIRQERLYTELTATFREQKQFKLLNKLIDCEIELESYCNE